MSIGQRRQVRLDDIDLRKYSSTGDKVGVAILAIVRSENELQSLNSEEVKFHFAMSTQDDTDPPKYEVKFHRYDDSEGWTSIPLSNPTYNYDNSNNTLTITGVDNDSTS